MASSAMLLRQWQRKSEPFQQEHPEQMWRDCELRSCGSMRQSRSCVVSGVRAEVSLASGSAARQHERPPELRVKDGGSPILPIVWPLSWIALFLFWWLLANVQCRPTWAPPEPLPVQKCRGRLQIPQTPTQRFLLSHLLHHLGCHLWCSLTNHLDGVRPRRPVGSWCTSLSGLETQPAQTHGERRQLLPFWFCVTGNSVEEGFRCLPNAHHDGQNPSTCPLSMSSNAPAEAGTVDGTSPELAATPAINRGPPRDHTLPHVSRETHGI